MKTATGFSAGLSAILVLALGCGADAGMVDPARAGGEGPQTSLAWRFSDWSEPVNLGLGINTTFPDQGAFVSKDELSLYFASNRPALPGPLGSFGGNDIYVSTRKNKHDSWGPGVNLGSLINTSGTESTPTLSPDEMQLYFATNGHGGTTGTLDIWVSTRLDRRDPLGWSAPVRLGEGVNSGANDLGPALFYDPRTNTLTMYLYSNQSATNCRDLYSSTLGESGEFGPAVPVAELNTPGEDEQPTVRRDGLEMFFVSNRPRPVGAPCLGPGTAGGEIWVSTRASTSDAWGPAVKLGSTVNSAGVEGRPSLSRDARSLYLFSDGRGGQGGTDLFVSTRERLDDDRGQEAD